MNDIQYVIMYYGFPILGLIITSIAQFFITTSYSKYKKVLSKSNKQGCDVARTILDKHNLLNEAEEYYKNIMKMIIED